MTTTTGRKGWAPLSTWLGRQYRMPDGSWITIRSWADIDTLEGAWAPLEAGARPEVETKTRREPDMSPEAVEERRIQKARHAEAVAFIAQYTGSFGLILSLRADPRWGSVHYRLSPRQVDVVLAARDRDAARLEMAQINTDIANADDYAAWMEAQRAVPATAPEAGPRSPDQEGPRLAAQPPTRPSLGSVTEGMYRMPDGTVAKVQRAVHGSKQLYAKRLRIGEGAGSFEYAPGLVRQLRPEYRMTLDEAAAFGKLYGWCCVCGRQLTDEKSIAAGIGPVCASKV